MLGDQRASEMVRSLRRCLISEVNLGIVCYSSPPSGAATALSDQFIAGCNQNDMRRRWMAWSASGSLGKL
jgi:hypothetical protein